VGEEAPQLFFCVGTAKINVSLVPKLGLSLYVTDYTFELLSPLTLRFVGQSFIVKEQDIVEDKHELLVGLSW
jgi:hypothetical protein